MPLTNITGMQIWRFTELKNTESFFSSKWGPFKVDLWKCYFECNVMVLFNLKRYLSQSQHLTSVFLTVSRHILGSSLATTRVQPYQMDIFAIWQARCAPYRWPHLPFCSCPVKVSVINVTLSQQVCLDGGPCRTKGVTNPTVFSPHLLE